MGHTYTDLLYHLVFSTKNRQPLIEGTLDDRLHAYLGGVVREERGTALQIGGMPDHVHLLVKWRPDEALSALMQKIKSHSSGWIHRTFPEAKRLEWQRGYSAFTVSRSQMEKTANFIARQKQHHRTRTFEEELKLLLKAHGIEFDPRYLE